MLAALKIALFVLAAAGEKSKTAFYIAGGVLALWAVVLSALGLRRADFPRSRGGSRAVMAISALLVVAAASMAVATASRPKKADQANAATPAAKGSARPLSRLALAADPSGNLKFDQSALSARAGQVTIVFANMSPVPHNVTIEGPGGRTLGATPTFQGGASRNLAVKLKAGSYTFYCSVPGHRTSGMQGTLVVS